MVFKRPATPSANPDLTAQIAEHMSGRVVPGGRLDVTANQVQVLRQTTIAGRPPVESDGPAVASVGAFLALLHGVPPRGGRALGLFLAYQADERAPWGISMEQSFSLLERPPKPFDALCVVNPLVGVGLGVYVHRGPAAALRAELADGTLLAEDRLTQRSLLVLLPAHASNGWTESEAPVFRLLDGAGHDIIPPMSVPLRRRPRPDASQGTER